MSSPPRTKYIPLEIVPRLITTTVHFDPSTSQETVELVAQAAAEKGSKIIDYFGLPPDGHGMGFTAHLSIDGTMAASITAVLTNVEKMTFEEEGKVYHDFCPDAICRPGPRVVEVVGRGYDGLGDDSVL